MGNARNLRYSRLTRAPPRRPARPRWDFIFDLEHARVEGRLRRRLPSPCRRKKALSARCQLICWPLLPTFLGRLAMSTQPKKKFLSAIKGGLCRGKCQLDKQALQIFLARLQLDDADVVVYTEGSKTPRPCCRAVERACFGCARGASHLSPR